MLVRRCAVGFVLSTFVAFAAAAGGCTKAEEVSVPPELDGGNSSGGPALTCTKSDDCPEKVCDEARGVCLSASCADGARNSDESDIDCGGSCARCDVQKACGAATDCASAVCADEGGQKRCKAPTCDDAVANGGEADVDCGGATCAKCVDGKKCSARSDCVSDVCVGGLCATPACDDGAKNGTDTDVDCGGPACPRCDTAKTCLVADDCASSVCADTGMGLRCQAPTCTDLVRNGGESDTDCGGPTCPKCATGRACQASGDCTSGGCNYKNLCAAVRSCTGRYGGDTCGLGGEGGFDVERWEDCCTKANVTPAGGTPVKLDKYRVTAGRMRAFLEDVRYDVRGFVRGARMANKVPNVPGVMPARSLLDAAWDPYLPTSFSGNTNADELADCAQRDWNGTTCAAGTTMRGVYTAVSRHLGGFIFRANAQTSTGCFPNSPGTHAFRFPDGMHDAPPEVGQDIYDTKAMQCIPYLVAQAFCVWDGGRLETFAEWQAAWGPRALPWSATTTKTPKGIGSSYWGCRFPWATDMSHNSCGIAWGANESIELADFNYSYEYPKLTSLDYIVHINAPGRLTGRGPSGHADIVGNGFEITSTVTRNTTPFTARHAWAGNGSWEGHGYNRAYNNATMLLNKYGKVGLRCAYP